MAFSAESVVDAKRDINVVPLIDVMLVLLIIFMVTAPILTREIAIDLPQPGPVRRTTIDPPPPLQLRIDAAGALYWSGHPLPRAALPASLQIETLGRTAAEQPTLEIETSPDASYAVLADVLAVARNVGVAKIGFVHGGLH